MYILMYIIISGVDQGFTFDLHHLVNPKSPQANFILEFSLAANLISKFSDLENCKKNLEL